MLRILLLMDMGDEMRRLHRRGDLPILLRRVAVRPRIREELPSFGWESCGCQSDGGCLLAYIPSRRWQGCRCVRVGAVM